MVALDATQHSQQGRASEPEPSHFERVHTMILCQLNTLVPYIILIIEIEIFASTKATGN